MLEAAIGHEGLLHTGAAGGRPDDTVRPNLGDSSASPVNCFASLPRCQPTRPHTSGVRPSLGISRAGLSRRTHRVARLRTDRAGTSATASMPIHAVRAAMAGSPIPSLATKNVEGCCFLVRRGPCPKTGGDRAGPRSPPPSGWQPLDRDRHSIGHQAVKSSRHFDFAVPKRPPNRLDHQFVNAPGAGREPRRLNRHMSVSNVDGWRPAAASHARAWAREREVDRAEVRVRVEGNSDMSPQAPCRASTHP